MWPLSINELFVRFQFVDRRGYFDLMMEVLNSVNVTFYVMTDQPDDALESVPIYLACMGAQIERNSPELYNDYLDTVCKCLKYKRTDSNALAHTRRHARSVKVLIEQAVKQFHQLN